MPNSKRVFLARCYERVFLFMKLQSSALVDFCGLSVIFSIAELASPLLLSKNVPDCWFNHSYIFVWFLVGLFWIFSYLLRLNRHLFGPHMETFIEKLQIFYLFKVSFKTRQQASPSHDTVYQSIVQLHILMVWFKINHDHELCAEILYRRRENLHLP